LNGVHINLIVAIIPTLDLELSGNESLPSTQTAKTYNEVSARELKRRISELEFSDRAKTMTQEEKDRELFNEMTREVKYKRWLIEVGELLEQLETQKDNCQDLWMEADSEFKGWQVKTKDNRWYHSDMAMKEVYSHLDSAIFFLKILKGENK
jgi:hypothetical protein